MAFMGCPKGVGSGGSVEAYVIKVAHPNVNEAKVYTGVADLVDNLGGIAYPDFNSSIEATDEHATGSYGGSYDFTITVSSNISVRIYAGAYGSVYFSFDLIKNGVTVVSDARIYPAEGNAINSSWSVAFVVS